MIPVRGASNVSNATLTSTVMDPGGNVLDPAATSTFAIDTGTGRFSGPPPSNVAAAVRGLFIPLVPALLPTLDITATIDSILPLRGRRLRAGGQRLVGICYEFFTTFKQGGLRAGAPPDCRPLAGLEADLCAPDGNPSDTAALGGYAVSPEPTNASRYGVPPETGFNSYIGATLNGIHPLVGDGERVVPPPADPTSRPVARAGSTAPTRA